MNVGVRVLMEVGAHISMLVLSEVIDVSVQVVMEAKAHMDVSVRVLMVVGFLPRDSQLYSRWPRILARNCPVHFLR